MNVKKGFTLIELMIVVAIVAILAMVVYPSYMDSMRQSRRSDAQAALMGLAQAMERFYTTDGTYKGAAASGADTGAPTIFSTKSPIDGSDTYYNLTIESATASAYELAATPDEDGPQAGEDTLTLKSTGERSW